MKKFLLGMLLMLMVLKPAVGIAFLSIFAEGMQTAASAMAEGVPKVRYDPNTSFVPPGVVYTELDGTDNSSKSKNADVEKEFEQRVMAIIEKRREHEIEQEENQRKLAEAEATVKAEKAGIDLFDVEFEKKFPKKGKQ